MDTLRQRQTTPQGVDTLRQRQTTPQGAETLQKGQTTPQGVDTLRQERPVFQPKLKSDGGNAGKTGAQASDSQPINDRPVIPTTARSAVNQVLLSNNKPVNSVFSTLQQGVDTLRQGQRTPQEVDTLRQPNSTLPQPVINNSSTIIDPPAIPSTPRSVVSLELPSINKPVNSVLSTLPQGVDTLRQGQRTPQGVDTLRQGQRTPQGVDTLRQPNESKSLNIEKQTHSVLFDDGIVRKPSPAPATVNQATPSSEERHDKRPAGLTYRTSEPLLTVISNSGPEGQTLLSPQSQISLVPRADKSVCPPGELRYNLPHVPSHQFAIAGTETKSNQPKEVVAQNKPALGAIDSEANHSIGKPLLPADQFIRNVEPPTQNGPKDGFTRKPNGFTGESRVVTNRKNELNRVNERTNKDQLKKFGGVQVEVNVHRSLVAENLTHQSERPAVTVGVPSIPLNLNNPFTAHVTHRVELEDSSTTLGTRNFDGASDRVSTMLGQTNQSDPTKINALPLTSVIQPERRIFEEARFNIPQGESVLPLAPKLDSQTDLTMMRETFFRKLIPTPDKSSWRGTLANSESKVIPPTLSSVPSAENFVRHQRTDLPRLNSVEPKKESIISKNDNQSPTLDATKAPVKEIAKSKESPPSASSTITQGPKADNQNEMGKVIASDTGDAFKTQQNQATPKSPEANPHAAQTVRHTFDAQDLLTSIKNHGGVNGVQKVELTLRPEALGKATALIEKVGDLLKLQFKVESTESQLAIEGETSKLKETLAAAGYHNVSIEFSVSTPSRNETNAQADLRERRDENYEDNQQSKEEKREETRRDRMLAYGYNSFEMVA